MLTSTAIALSTIVSTVLASRGYLYMPDPNHPDDYQKFTSGSLDWYYTYEATEKTELASSGMSFVPMLWGDKDGKKENWISQVDACTNVEYVLGMNEPDMDALNGGSDMGVSDAVALYQDYMNPLAAKGIKVGTPACSSADAGVAWIKQFMTACSDCTISFVALHYYGNAAGLAGILSEYHEAFPTYKLWVTEWADAHDDSLSDTESETQKMLTLMDGLDYVERYSYFGAVRANNINIGSNAALLDDNGNLNALGGSYMVGGASTPASTSAAYVAPTTSAAYVAPTSTAVYVAPTSTSTPAYVAPVYTATAVNNAVVAAVTHATTMQTVYKPAVAATHKPTTTTTHHKKTKATKTAKKSHHRSHRHGHKHKHASKPATTSAPVYAEHVIVKTAYVTAAEYVTKYVD